MLVHCPNEFKYRVPEIDLKVTRGVISVRDNVHFVSVDLSLSLSLSQSRTTSLVGFDESINTYTDFARCDTRYRQPYCVAIEIENNDHWKTHRGTSKDLCRHWKTMCCVPSPVLIMSPSVLMYVRDM